MTLRGGFGLSFTEEERAFLQQRVALLFKFVFLTTLVFDVLHLLLMPETLLKTGVLIDKASTVTFGALWLLLRRRRRSALFVLAVEWVGLGTASVLIAVMSRYLAWDLVFLFTGGSELPNPGVEMAVDSYVSFMALFGGGLLFVIRAAFVPSPPLRTFTLTALLGVPYLAIPHFFGPAAEGTAPPLRALAQAPSTTAAHVVGWAIVAVSAAAVSHVIYGLRAQVREARRLGQYTLEGKVGEGGMGIVYRARHGMMRRPTAVKLLKPEHAAEDNLKRFEREVQLTARLTHPHTITIFDYGRTPDGVFYYAMELLEGASLARLVSATGPLSPARVVHVLHCVAGALTEAHDVGLIHRDIKPANIILCRQGGMDDYPKVVDFGLVKDLERGGGAGLTQADVVAGTPLYLAPEAINAPETVSGQSDLYSLGAVGYFALTGTNVFDGRTLVEVCSHHLHSPPEPPSTRVGGSVPPDLEALILDCLLKDPAARPAGAHAVRRRLESCEAFGAWTTEEARSWWAENGESLTADPPTVEDAEATLTRQTGGPTV